jgi:hypothetical protein
MLVRQAMLKYVAPALLPELLTDVATGVDEYVSYVPATILVAGDDEVPGVTRRMCRINRVRECLCVTQGITEDDEFIICMESADFRSGVMGGIGVSVHAIRAHGFPDSTVMIMIGHSFVSLLFSSKLRD